MKIEHTAAAAKFLFLLLLKTRQMGIPDQLEALFFDFDGVIVDSNSTKTEAFGTLFGAYDRDIVDQIVAYHRSYGGISRVEKIRYAHEHFIGQPLTEAEVGRWSARYSELVVEKVIAANLIKGAMEFLESHSQSLPVFVISGTPEDELTYIIERRNMLGLFREILGSPVKKPDHIRNLLAGYRLAPERCIFIGDALTDYHAARETGMHFIGVQSNVSFPEGTTVLTDCRELEEAIGSLFIKKSRQQF